MALSEFERLELDNISQGLLEEDPRLAALMSLEDLDRRRWKGIKRGCLAALGGLGLLLVSFPLGSLALGVVGFLVMGGGTYWATLFMGDRPMRWRPRTRENAHEKNKEQS
ncbi:DUF3040 domain-containing protein [Arthrobacter sp. AK01]|uniref:DUF3040 domain-containing protein n=1 Tax=Micrococcaceae TaxID=1268 RepID=UPI001E2F2955|nr:MULTISPECIES: DUF3040 domain-containing protein [Micrococcaceae]MCD4851578.1 DUF3040 domain-containing protein [Arthrobacter sp. AK01]MCP1413823.1 hypothetical protein [Paenarthrobacter sp. A20]MCT9868226.1 DUF3040 domain-containing protein [Paenarthrobacter aurescens]